MARGLLSICVLCLLLAAGAAADLTAQQKGAALDAHNEIRSDVARGLVGDEPTAANMVKLAWDDDLAQVAQGWVARCSYGHNPNRTNEYGALAGGSTYVGENLAVYITNGTPPDIIDFALDLWFEEQADYSYGPFDSSDLGAAGHYTQLAWANTHRVGCGLALCPGSAFGYPNSFTAYYFGCDYARGGNLYGSYPYESGATASHCPNDYPSVENGLCAMPEPGRVAMLGSGVLALLGLRRRARR